MSAGQIKETLNIDDEKIAVDFRRSNRAKRMILKVGVGGGVEVVVPRRVSWRVARRFVQSQAIWVKKEVDQKRKESRGRVARKLGNGELLPVLGDVRRLVIETDAQRRRTRWIEERDEIIVKVVESRQVKPTLIRWYKSRAKDYYWRRASDYAQQLGVEINRIAISDARTQWGSCLKRKGRLSIQWRLALGPLWVADYVIAHEVAHLKESGHSDRFWGLVRMICPEYAEGRAWLRKNGQIISF